MNRWIVATLVALLGLGTASSAPAAVRGVLGGQFRYGVFNDGNDLRDVIAYWAARKYHVQLEYWDWVNPETPDQFRSELGLHLRDRRQSVYTFQWRHEHEQERFWFTTEQILIRHVVGRVEVSPIVSSTSTLWVVSAGADYYWSDWNFASFGVIRDPRQNGLWIWPMRVRLANEANDWVQLTFAPASQNSLGWAVEGKKRWLRLGVERNNRYDFTNVDNVFISAGFELPFPRPK